MKQRTKDRLDTAKIIQEEPYDAVINRALDALQEKNAPKVPAGVTA